MSHVVVLVTGCSSGGIGHALCEEFARRGCQVYATSRKESTIGEFKDSSSRIAKLGLDVTSDEDVERVVKHIIEVEGRIDILVNNAGKFCSGPLIDQSLEEVKDIFDTNTFAVLRLARAVIPLMATRKSGLVMNIGSVVGEIATPWNGLYCATKAAMQSLSDVLSMECKPLGISVLHVAPGSVVSKIAENGTRTFELAEDSLYKGYLGNIMKRINASQNSRSMDTGEFARRVVSAGLSRPGSVYLCTGGNVWLFKVLRWLPKQWVLWLMWREYSQ